MDKNAMKKIIAGIFALFLGAGAAQAVPPPVTGYLQATNPFNEINLNGTQATALAHLGSGAVVPTTAALEALPTSLMTAGTTVIKYGWYAAGDMPPLSYVLQTSACSLGTYAGAGSGDGFSQFPAQGGYCWVFPSSAPSTFDVAQAGVVRGGTDPNNNNAAQLNAIFQYNHALHVAGAYETPALTLDGPVIGIDAGVKITSGYINFTGALSLKALNNLGGGLANPTMPTGSGNWCPAMITISTNSGTKNIASINLDENNEPVYGFDNEINGLQQYTHIYGKNWSGSCGGPTPLSGTFTAGSPIVTMANTTGYAPGQVIHNMFPTVPYLTYIAAVDANTDIVLNQPANVSTTTPVDAYNDSGGGEAGAFGNAGGQLIFSNFNEYQSGDSQLGDAATTYGNAYSMWPGANDVYLTGGLYENATCGIYMDTGGGGLHVEGHPEITNASWNVAKSASSTIAGTTATLGGTITNPPIQIGMMLTGAGITGFPVITAQLTGTTGQAGTYTISTAETVSTAEQITETYNVKNPCGIGLADSAGTVSANGFDFGGDVVQITVDSSGVQNFVSGLLRYASSANSTVSPPDIVQIQNINQTNPNLGNITVDPFESNLIGGLGYVSLTNYGTGSYTGALNVFNGPVNLAGYFNFNAAGGVAQVLLPINAYNNNYTALNTDSGADSVWANAATAYTTTLPNTLPAGWNIPFDALAIGTSTDTLVAATGATMNGVAGGSVVISSNTEGTLRVVTNSTGTNAAYTVNFQGFQQVPHSPTGSYTFSTADCGDIVHSGDGSTASTFTVPVIPLGSVQGCVITLDQTGAGVITITNGAGVTLNGSSTTAGSYSQALSLLVPYTLVTFDGSHWNYK